MKIDTFFPTHRFSPVYPPYNLLAETIVFNIYT